jgi:putative RNA 2'-phosphotransferase
MHKRKPQESFAKLLEYVLGRNPFEFGLIPDPEGYVKVKDLLRAISEEQGWGHIRRGHLNEVLLVVAAPPIEIAGPLVRSVDRGHLPSPQPASHPPKQMVTWIRRRAYPVVLEKGVLPWGHPMVVLSEDRALAERIGKRYDAHPVLLTVSVTSLLAAGRTLRHAGGSLYLTEEIPADCFTGPPPEKLREEHSAPKAPAQSQAPRMPGSFVLDMDKVASDRPAFKSGRDKKEDWKRERRRMNRRQKGKGDWE